MTPGAPVDATPPPPARRAAAPRRAPGTDDGADRPRDRLLLRVLGYVGAPVRRGTSVALSVAALAAGTAAEAARPRTWRRTVRAEFRRCLRHALAGGLGTTLAIAVLVGLSMVYQALYWLGMAGQQGLAGNVLATVLVRETAPVLVGLILLGRSGTVTVVEFGEIAATGQVRLLEGQGLDPFQLLVLPRTLAYALAGFTLGMIFLAVALAAGYFAGSALGVVPGPARDFLGGLIGALGKRDFALLPAKLVLIGALVALTSAVTGLSSTPHEKPAHLLPRGSVRGVLAVLATSAALSAAAA
jgi:phospholipid/cholesterol/gamma-HCH transport system permease protein